MRNWIEQLADDVAEIIIASPRLVKFSSTKSRDKILGSVKQTIIDRVSSVSPVVDVAAKFGPPTITRPNPNPTKDRVVMTPEVSAQSDDKTYLKVKTRVS